ncbi:MAG: WD40 repeat domain-containing protein [Thermoguttaceae bacterium]|nr:WD40 repeat domain-containing protein [Thermoguttaceae bacterium]
MKKFSSFGVCFLTLMILGFASFVSAEPMRVSSFKTIQMEPITSEGRAPVVTGLSISKDGQTLVTVGDDHKARIWNVTDGRLKYTLNDQQDWVRSVKFSPDGKTFVTGGMDNQLYCYDAKSFQRTLQFESARTAVRSIAFDPTDSSRMAVIGYDASVFIYETAYGRKTRTWETTCSDQRSVQFSADSRFVAAAGRDGNVRLFDMATGRIQTDLARHTRRVWAIAFSEDGKYLATGGEDKKIYIWSMKDFSFVRELDFPSGKVTSLTFCGSDTVAAGAASNLICVWNLRSADSQPTYVLSEHKGTVADLLWDSANQTLISCGFDSTVRFWKWQTQDMAISEIPVVR